MNKHNKNYRKKELKISSIETTNDRLTGRAGLALFVAYLHQIQIFPILDRFFGSIRKNKKGLEITELMKQILCFMFDGTSRHLPWFDQLSKDAGYADSIETDMKNMASSHRMKRSFNAFAWTRIFLFRRLLQALFIWRLNIKKPHLIELGIDTMVMNNDDAKCRHGVKPTYRKKRGFQPLQMNWGRLIVDAVFRGGNKHSNHGDTVQSMIKHMIKKIRKQYRADVPIIIRMDSGFLIRKFLNCAKPWILVMSAAANFTKISLQWQPVLMIACGRNILRVKRIFGNMLNLAASEVTGKNSDVLSIVVSPAMGNSCIFQDSDPIQSSLPTSVRGRLLMQCLKKPMQKATWEQRTLSLVITTVVVTNWPTGH